MVGVRFDHKKNPITIRATTAPIIAHFWNYATFEGASFAAGRAAPTSGRLNFSGTSKLPTSSVRRFTA